jgi:hypothetical protein
MRSCLALIWGLVLSLSAVLMAAFFIPRCGRVHDEDLAADLRQKTEQIGNQVVECRFLVNGFGSLIPGAQPGTWRDVVTLPEYGSSTVPCASVIIIFIHGFNTSLGDAVMASNAIVEGLRSSGSMIGKRDLIKQELKFFTFCWRGDLGPWHGHGPKKIPGIAFAAAEIAARNSAPSLSAFVKKLQCLYPCAKMILMSHSLGALVALEVLQNLYKERPSTWIDSLLMVQPAVRWCEVYEGDFLVPEDASAPTQAGKAYTKEHYVGQYSICINAAHEVVVTQSSLDRVLSGNFRGYRSSKSLPSIGDVDIDIALGFPCKKDEWRMHHPAYREILLSPDPASNASKDIHTRWNEDQTIVNFIYNCVLAKYFIAPDGD